MAPSSEVTQQDKLYLCIPQLPQGPRTRVGSKPVVWQKNPTKQASTLTKLQVRRKWGTHRKGCNSLQADYEHPRLPVMRPALPTKPGHRPSNPVYYCYDVLHIEIFKLRSANIISEIHCLKYCTNHKCQVKCYILQISQDVNVVMSLSAIYCKYVM